MRRLLRKPKMSSVMGISGWRLWIGVGLVCGCLLGGNSRVAGAAKVNPADGFDFPVGKPNAAGYYKARGMRLRSPTHFGEDWNGRSGGDSDLGDPVFACADGIVTFAHNVRQGWGNVVLVRHAFRDPASGEMKFIDSLYGHLNEISVKIGQVLKRGEQLGTIGSNFGMYPAHLHFEIRLNITIGMFRNDVASDLTNWADPTQFINKYRRLNREWRPVEIPTGTYKEYVGFPGL